MDSQKSTKQHTRRRRGAPVGNQNARTHGLYSSRVAENDRDLLQSAVHLKGLEGEIALIRLKIRRIAAYPDSPPDLLFRAINTLARTLEINEQLNNLRRRWKRSEIAPPSVEACPELAEEPVLSLSKESELFSHILGKSGAVLALELDITSETIPPPNRSRNVGAGMDSRPGSGMTEGNESPPVGGGEPALSLPKGLARDDGHPGAETGIRSW